MRYHNGTPGRQFTEQILAYNAVTIDRADMSSPDADTYGNGDSTLYEPGNNGLAITEIDGQRAYGNKASRYQRLMLLNTADLARSNSPDSIVPAETAWADTMQARAVAMRHAG